MNSGDQPDAATATAGQGQPYPWQLAYPEGIDWNLKIEVAPLPVLIDRAAAKFGARPCTNFLGQVQTYQQIHQRIEHTAAGLAKLGVVKGTKVGLFLPNCPTFIIYYFAVLKLGGTIVNYNPLYTIEELAHQVNDSETEIMVTLDLKALFVKVEQLISTGALKRAVVASFVALLPTSKGIMFRLFKAGDLASIAGSTVAAQVVRDADVVGNDATYTKPVIDPHEDVAVLQYTGGTTGTPKGAMLTHANLYANTMQVAAWAPGMVDGTERILGLLPFFHVFAMTVVMNFGVARAAEIVIMPRFVLDDAIKLIDRTRPTNMPGVPTVFNAISTHPKIASYDLSSLKFCMSGGAPLPLEVKQRFEQVSGSKVVEGYGLSETSPVATANPIEGRTRDRSIGQPLPDTVVSIRAIEDSTIEQPLGTEGEICIAGPQVMKGYWKRPDETAKVMVGRFLRTGDIGKMDADGFFYITDRLKDMIICSGFKVFPRYVEDKIYQHPAVAEVTVIGIKDAYRGEAPKAFVKLKPGTTLTADELLVFLAPKLSKIELPAEIEFRDELPKTMIGKLSKKELKAEENGRSKGA